METRQLMNLLDYALKTGATFSDIFYEDTITRYYLMQDRQIDRVDTKLLKGVGIRISFNDEIGYTYTNDLSEKNLYDIIEQLQNCYDKAEQSIRPVFTEKDNMVKAKIPHDKKTLKWKKEILLKIDQVARNYSSMVTQVKAQILENDQLVKIASSDGNLVSDKRSSTRLMVNIIVEKDGEKSSCFFNFANGAGYELFETFDLEAEVKNAVDLAIEGLDAKPCPSGKMPVIIESGFGAIIFHEACGHAMEASSVADQLSVLSGKVGEKVASSKVTIIDDGTITNAWGSLVFDDEGNNTQKNYLIENGVLKGYLIDRLNASKIKLPITGSGRRQNYCYLPTSRMNNTYLENGNDNVEDMIKSIDFGLYVKSFNGGSVQPATGEFNFSASEAYLIRDGKMAERVKGASLIGSSLEILEKIEMVANNKQMGPGYCGASSGWVPVGCGQPTIKVSSILVGGAKNNG